MIQILMITLKLWEHLGIVIYLIQFNYLLITLIIYNFHKNVHCKQFF